jgi:5-methyltetrahydrofolate--homocysteine methyltransferase
MAEPESLTDAIIRGRHTEARALTEAAIAAGADPLALVHDAMIPAMNEVGRRFECQEYFVPQLLMSARAMKSSMEIVRPLLASTPGATVGTVVLGTVHGDLHDIGKNLVAALLEGGGFSVHDLGVNVAPETFVEGARAHDADIVGLSALLTTTMPAMKATIDAFDRAGLRGRVKIIVGGAPVAQPFADEIGADGFSPTAPGAVALSRHLLGIVP